MNTKFLFKRFLQISILVFFGIVLFTSEPVFAALPPGFEIQTVATGMNLPTGMAFTTDGRVFIAEKDGTVRLLKNGTLQVAPVVKLSDVNTYGDRGLLGIALDPNFQNNGYLYLLYTYENTPGANIAASKTGRLIRVTVVGDTASEASKIILLGTTGGTLSSPSCENYATGTDCIPSDSLSHSVAGLRFGPDNKLYVTIGDGSSFDYADPRSLRAQSLDSLSGKMLRINTDGTAPNDNPYYNGSNTANRSKVYALGFRNSFRFNFRPSNQAIFAGDVGWSNWEEVNLVVPGANYGWPCREGMGITVAGLNCTPSTPATDPLYVYPHDSNGAGSVTGGTFTQGSVYPAAFSNAYFFGDYAQNFIKYLLLDANNQVISVNNFAVGSDGTDGPVDFVTAPDGTVYFLGIYTGSIKKITYTLGNRQPNAVLNTNVTSGSLPLLVNFSAASSSDPDGNPLTYAWDFGNGATSSLSSPSFTYTATGTYTATVKVSDNQGGFDTKSVLIKAGNQAPTISIVSPASGALYVPGTTIQLTGAGNDPETGLLASNAFSWRVIIHHNTHIHVLQTMTGVNSTFIAPDHSDPDVYLEVELTGIDPAGIATKNSILMYLNNTTQTNGNLIANPSIETPQVGNAATPDAWFKGGYGVNNAIFTYPISGYDGASALRLEINNFTDGDAKWFFSPVYINENTDYRFSDYYQSNAPSRLSAQFGYNNGTYSYIDFGVIPTATNWTKLERTFRAPAGARTVTVFHGLANIGVLSTDAYSLMASSSVVVDNVAPAAALTSPSSSANVSGVVTVTATATDNVGVSGVTLLVDGVVVGAEKLTVPYSFTIDTNTLTNGTHTLAVRARDAAGNLTTSSNITVNVSNSVAIAVAPNLILNGSLDSFSSTSPAKPTGWQTGKFGTNTTIFSYPVSGLTGNAVQVAMTARTSGDAKWYFNDVSVLPGQTFDLAFSYKSNATTTIALRYLLTNGTYSYPTLEAVAVPAMSWKNVSYRFTVPAGVVKVTAFQILNRIGTLTTDEYSLRLVDTIKPTAALLTPTNNQAISGSFAFNATSSDNVQVVSVKLLIDGAVVASTSNRPYVFTIDTTTLTNGNHTAYVSSVDSANNVATSSTQTFVVQNSITDATPPMVTIQNPIASSSLSGIVNLSTTATDVNGVTYVKYFIDGVALGGEQFTSPYALTWDTTMVTNGSHTITARAFDALNNVGSSTISVTVNNTPTATSTNLIVNPSFEAVNGNNPLGWSPAGFGSSTRTFTYPIIGEDGNKAVRVSLSNYVDGDAKWAFNDVNVSAGTLYRFTTKYRSNTISDVIGQYTFTDGSVSYFGLQKEIQPTSNWTTINATFTPPVNIAKVTLFQLISANGYLEIDDTGLYAIGSTTVNTDTSAPIVSFTTPSNNAVVSGLVNITASSSDNIGVTYVIYALDGNIISPQLTSSPYTFVWDSRLVANGTHTLKATTHDAVGNNDTNTITITVNNQSGTTTSTSTNLIENPSFADQAGITPTSWFKGGWGTNTTNFTYPVVGRTDNFAAQLAVTSFTNGDAKWYFAPKAVLPGDSYTFSNYYKSDATSTLTARYTLADASNVYIDIATLAPSQSNWTKSNVTIVPPANTVTVTIFHSLRGLGTLVVDDYTLSPMTAVSDPTVFNKGLVSLVFDDGWLSHSTNVLPILNAGNIKGPVKGVFAIVSLETLDALPYNRISNASVETEGAINVPIDWSIGNWGTNNAVFTYPVSGYEGGKGINVSMTNYTDGDAKWYFKDATVVDGQLYNFSDWYISDVPTIVTARYNMGGGVYVYADLGTAPAATTWTQYVKQFTMPAKVESFTVMHRLTQAGSLTIDNVDFSKAQIFVSPAQVLQMQAGGHEISSHSQTHPSLSSISTTAMQAEVSNSKPDLLGMGVNTVNTLVYPYGDYSSAVETALVNAGYLGARSVDRGYNLKTTNKFELKTQQVDVTTTLDQIKIWIDTAALNKTWLTLMFHQVDGGGLALSTTPQILNDIVAYLGTKNVDVVTLQEGISQMNP